MAKVLSVIRTDLLNNSMCQCCNEELGNKNCELALYSGKGKKRILETYASYSLLYCKDCGLFFVTSGDLTYIRESTGYHALARTYAEYIELRKGSSKKSRGKSGYANVKNPEEYVIGKELVHKGDNLSYGRGIIKGMDRGNIIVRFDAYPKKSRTLSIFPELMWIYHFKDSAVSAFLHKQAETNDARRNCYIDSTIDLDQNELPTYNIVDDGEIHPVIVHRTVQSFCAFKRHPIENRDHRVEMRSMVVRSLRTNKDVKICAEYCYDCDEYKIDEPAIEHYEKKYGKLILLKRDMNERFTGDFNSIAYNWEKETPLVALGYSAGANAYTTEERHYLLSYIIDNRLLDLSQVMFYIKQAISLGMINYAYNIDANERRQDDIDFLEGKYLRKSGEYMGELEQSKR